MKKSQINHLLRALAASIVIFPVGLAIAGPYPGSLKDHGHTGSGDGGSIANLTLTTSLSAPNIIGSGGSSTFSVGGSTIVQINSSGLNVANVTARGGSLTFSINGSTRVLIDSSYVRFSTGGAAVYISNNSTLDPQIFFYPNSVGVPVFSAGVTKTDSLFHISNSSTLGSSDVAVSSGSSSGLSVKGRADGVATSAGFVGEFTSSATSSANFGATGVWVNPASLLLTAGNWTINACVNTTANGATVTNVLFGISTTPGNSATGLTFGTNALPVPLPNVSIDSGNCIPWFVEGLTSSTSYYLKLKSTFTVATPQASGIIWARRN